MDGVIGHEFGDHRLTGGADQLGGAPTPGRGLHRERDLLRRVVIKVGGPPAGSAHMGGHHIGTGEDLHDVPGGAGMQALSDQPPRHAVERLADLEMRIDSDGANRPRGQLEGPGRQRDQRITFDRLEHSQWLGALQGTAVPGAGHLAAPAQRVGLHLAQRGELATFPERVPHIGHGSLHPGFVLGLERARRVDQGAVVHGQLGVGAVDLRVIQVGFVHPGLEVVTHQPGRHSAEELERRDMTRAPRGLIHPDHRAHEQVPRTRQHHHERPHRDPAWQRQDRTTCPSRP